MTRRVQRPSLVWQQLLGRGCANVNRHSVHTKSRIELFDCHVKSDGDMHIITTGTNLNTQLEWKQKAPESNTEAILISLQL